MKISYLFFHQHELDEVLRSLKHLVEPKYKRYRFSEVVAAGDGVLVGKYREIVFVATSKPVDVPIEEIGRVEVEVCLLRLRKQEYSSRTVLSKPKLFRERRQK